MSAKKKANKNQGTEKVETSQEERAVSGRDPSNPRVPDHLAKNSLEMCRVYLTSSARIRRVSRSCSKRETRSKLEQ